MTPQPINFKPRLLPPVDVDERLHQIVQGATPLVTDGTVSQPHTLLLLALGWSLEGAPLQWSRRHWIVTLRGERGALEIHQRSGQVAGGSLALRGQQPRLLDWRGVEAALRWEGRTSPEDRCEPLGRVVEQGPQGVVLEIDGGEP